jgi:hypothetical protein
VLDAPISEDAMVGAAIGAAIEGMRPIIEMQFADFSTTGIQPNRQPGRHALLADECALPHHDPSAFGRHFRQRAVSQPEHGGDLRALSGFDCHDAGDGGGRLQHVAGSGGD